MNDTHKTKAQLINELEELRQQVARLEGAETQQIGDAPFLTMAEAAASAIFVFRDSEFLYANPVTAKLTGYTVEELIGIEIWTLIHHESRELIQGRVLAWQRGERVPPRSELKIVTKSGETRWINADSTFTKFGESPAVLTIAYDSTEYKVAQEALRISEERYRNIMETAQEAIWVVDPKANTTYVNERLAQMLGYEPQEILGHSVFDFVDPADHQETRHYLERGRRGFKERLDYRFRRKDGSYIWTMLSTTPLFDVAGEFIGGLAMLIDITERRRSEEALQRSEERLRTYIEQANDLIFILDRSGRMTSVNKATCDTTGYAVEELLGGMPADFVVPEQRVVAANALRSILQGEPVDQIEFDILSKDGRRIAIEVRGRTLHDGDQISGVFQIARDITGRKQAERALKESEALLHAAIENLPFEFWTRDRSGRCIVQNPYSVLQWGNQVGNTLEQTAPDTPTRELWQGQHQRALAGEVVKAEFEIASGDQTGSYYSVVAPIRVDSEVTGVLRVNIDITGRKQAEEALRESEEKFRALAESTAAAIFIYRGEKLLYVNPATSVSTGYEADELLRLSFWDVIHPEFRNIVRERGLARQRDELFPERYEFKIITKTGETRWIDATASLLEYEGKPAAIGTAFDITEHKRAQDELREAQEKLHHVLLYSPAIIYSLKVEGSNLTTEWISESLTRLTGYDVEEAFSGTWWVDNIHPDDRARVLDTIQRLFVDDRRVLEYRFQHKDRGYVWVHDEIKLLRDESGRAVEAIGSWVDVTERREAEAALRDSEERFRMLVTSMTDTVFTLDREHRITAVFGRLTSGSGLDPKDLLGKTARELFGPDAARVHQEAAARALDGEQIVYEWSGVYDQNELYYQTSLSPMHNQSGEVTGLVGVGRDITERKRLDRALQESEVRFSSFMAHLPAYAWIKKMDGGYVFINELLRETLSHHQQDWMGRTDPELFPPEIAAQYQRNDQIVATEKRALQIVEAWTWKGEPRHAFVTKFPIFDEQGNMVMVAGASVDITALKQAEDELRKQKELLQATIDNIPVMISIRGRDGRHQLVNPQWERTLGWTRDEIVEQDIDVLAQAYPDPDKRQRVLDFFDASTGEWAEFKTRTKDGRIIDTIWASVRLADGPSLQIGRDITERKLAEEALRRSEERFRSYFELGLIGIAITSPTKGWIEVNDQICEILGYERSELWQTTWANLTHPDDLAADVANFDRVLGGEIDSYSMEKRFVRKDGQTVFTASAVRCLRRGDGSVDYFVALLQDITDRKRMEDALRNSERKYKDIFTFSPVGIYQALPDGTIVTANEALAQILGYDSLEALLEINLEHDVFLDPAERRRVIAICEASGYSGEVEVQWKRRGGTPFWVQINVHAVRDAPSGLRTFEGFVLDITERKRADGLLRRQTAELAALHDIGLEISAESDLSRVLDIVTRRAAELLKASHCSTFISNRQQAELRIVASLEADLIGSRLKHGEGLAGMVALTAGAQMIDDYSEWDGRASVYEGRGFGPSLGAPFKWQQTVIGSISMSRSAGDDRFTDEDSRLLQQLAAEAAIAIHQATLIDELQESRGRLQVLSHRLIDAQEAERKRLARELHDQIGQALTAIQINLQSTKSLPDGGTASIVEDCLAIIDESLQLVHDLSFDLRPSLLDDLGLGAALRWYVERATARADLLTCLNVDALGGRLSSEVETACFRIAQESLTNVLRHAYARTVSVTVSQEDGCLKLLVEDDGVGFDVPAAMDRKGPNTSLGLQGMQERASALGGIVEIKSNPGNGTEIEARFPL
jgi:PAS domain S-box-containing protein